MRYEEKLSPTNQNKSLYIHRNPYPWQCHTVDQSIPFTIAIAIDPEPIQEIFGLVLMMLLIFSTGVLKISYTYLPHFAHCACLLFRLLRHLFITLQAKYILYMIYWWFLWWWCCGVEWKWVTDFRPFIVYGVNKFIYKVDFLGNNLSSSENRCGWTSFLKCAIWRTLRLNL